MPKRTDIKKILIIGSGPIVIGQACEFDYSGTQACKALREQGYEVVLVNSNPATIMTDPQTDDRTYVEPITPEAVAKVIERERPCALLPNMGGQTALNCAVALDKAGILQRYGVEVIGCDVRSIEVGEDRELFAAAMRDIGYHFPDTAAETLNVDSKILLKKTIDLIATKGYVLGNIDATICAERPKLNPHVPAMKACLAQVMNTDEENISIKATTTEKLGFTGRMEGISAYATVLIEKV